MKKKNKLKKSQPRQSQSQQVQQEQPLQQETTPKFTVFVPSDHDILLKVVPSKKFFENKTSEVALKEFGLDDQSLMRTSIRWDVENEYSKRLDSLAYKLPENVLKDLATSYMKIRNLKGNVKINEGLVKITDSKGKTLNLRLDHMLNIICSFPQQKNGDYVQRELSNYKKIAKTSKIDARTRKSF